MKLKTRLQVKPEQVKEAESLGAKYDGRMKSYYVPEHLPLRPFESFMTLPIELVPSSNWEKNVRSEYQDEWRAIKRKVYQGAGYKCEVCGGKGDAHPVECHEKWTYDMDTKIQRLECLVALCTICHKTQHWGYALIHGMEKDVRKRILTLNGWKDEDLNKYLNEVFDVFEERSKVNWTLDMTALEHYR